MADESNIPPTKYRGLRDYVKAEQMVQLALAIPIGCFVGWALGGLLDGYFHTSWIAIAGTVAEQPEDFYRSSRLPCAV